MYLDILVPVLIPAVITVVTLALNRRKVRAEVDSAAVTMALQTNGLVRDSYTDLLERQREQTEAELDKMRTEIGRLRDEIADLRARVAAEHDELLSAERRFGVLWRWTTSAINTMREAGMEPPPIPAELDTGDRP